MSVAREFHEETNHEPGFGFRPGTRRLTDYQRDPSRLPIDHKQYTGLPRVKLPATSPSTRRAVDVLSGLTPSGGDVDVAMLARVLAFSAGVTRVIDMGGGRTRNCRAASSAHSYPDVHVVCGDVDGAPAGVWYFDWLTLELVELRRGDFRAALASAAADDAVASSPATLVITGVPWRAAWNYGERALRHVYWDTGGLLANMTVVADAWDVSSRVLLGFVDPEVAAIVGVDNELQFPVALCVLGSGSGSAQEVPALGAVQQPPITAGEPVLFPLVQDAHHDGDLADAGAVGAWRANAVTAEAPPAQLAPADAPDEPIEEPILRRGSTRRMRPEAVPRTALDWALAAATRPARGDWVQPGSTLLDHHAVVHAVDGVAPGVHRYDSGGLRLVRGATLRDEARFVSLNQGQGGDGAYTTFHCADLDRALGALGSRGYRAAQVEAGWTLERLHLAVFALGVGATGLTFFDGEVSKLVGTPTAVMTQVAVGMPAYRARKGGLGPGATRIPGRAFDLYMQRMQELEAERQR